MSSAIFGIFAGSFFGGTTGSLLQPILRRPTQDLEALYKTNISDPASLILQRIRGIIPHEHYLELMAKWGYNEAQAERMRIANFNLLGLGELVTLYRRKHIDLDELHGRGKHLGFTTQEIDRAIKALEVYPNPSDIIRFYVREVYTKDIRERFKLDDGFEALDKSKAAEVGISESILRDFWAAHWELPSVTAFNEMLYRFAPEDKAQWEAEMQELGISTKELETTLDLGRLLYKTQDVMPFWRERMIAIAYRGLTRVDVRRMIRLKLLTPAQALYQFKKEGYTPTDARRLTWFSFIFESLPDWIDQLKATQVTLEEIRRQMTEWAIPRQIQEDIIARKLVPATEAQVSEEKQIVKGEIKKAVELGQIDRLGALDLLKRLGYTEVNAKFIFEIWQGEFFAKMQRERDLSITDNATLYELGRINRAELQVRLARLGLDPIEIEDKLFIIDAKIEAKKAREEQGQKQKNKDLSFTDQRKLFEAGLIDLDEFRARLLAMGYNEQEAQDKINLVIVKILEREQKDA